MPKTDEQLAAEIKEKCSHEDTEAAHGDADDLIVEQLRALGYWRSADAWAAVDKWYS